jgi:hypothetical protein
VSIRFTRVLVPDGGDLNVERRDELPAGDLVVHLDADAVGITDVVGAAESFVEFGDVVLDPLAAAEVDTAHLAEVLS